MKRSRRQVEEVDLVSILRESVSALSVLNVTSSDDLVCRDEQAKIIMDFFTDNIGNTMQVFGMPGTGKTATIHHALSKLAQISKIKPTAVFLNGYVVQKSTDIFWTLYLHLAKARSSSSAQIEVDQCAAYIEKKFRHGWDKEPGLCVIVIDEVDKILKKHPKALFKIIDWMSLPFAKCKLVTISNSMELAIDAKTKSRLDITKRLVFSPYGANELQEIITRRLKHIDTKVFSDQAIKLLCFQTAAQYGDVRRLLQCAAAAVCNQLIAFEDENVFSPKDFTNGIISVKEIHSVIRQIFHDGFIEFVKTIRSPIFFVVICLIAKRSSEIQRTETESRIPLEYLFLYTNQSISRCFPRMKSINRTSFCELVNTLREVGLIDISLGNERVPISTLDGIILYNDEAFVSLLQPIHTVVDACRFHEEFSSYGNKLL